jgi:hypothetical protein
LTQGLGIIALIKLAIGTLPNMTSYDSDSSLDDQIDYAETSVLLGYASKETSDDAISHLGGTPVRGSHPFTGSGPLLTEMLTDMARASNFTVRQPSQMQSLQWLHVSAVATERRSTVPFS